MRQRTGSGRRKDAKGSYDPEWDLFLSGSTSALGAIYDRHILLLYRYGHTLTTSRSLVEDSIQDVFAELWKRHHQISRTTSVKFYLFRCLRNRILYQLKQYRTSTLSEEALNISHVVEESLDEEQVHELRQALTHLGPRQREAIYLKFYNRLNNDDIAAIMDIDKRTVYNLVSLALKRLQYELKPTLGKLLMVVGWFVL